ncbi:MAG TPA: SRPBCC domain-containing protein [Opitutaceae bacterium]|nr:SRPBCC domain-containing protein [Opitutaceae bacterium]
MTKTIRQNVTVGAAPRKVFGALMNERKHAKFTGAPARISRKVGGAFTCYGGHITGINLELVPARRIVQSWRARGWPAGTHSIVSFVLSRKAGGRTRISFTHLGVPSSKSKDIEEGWRTFYWKKMKGYLEK